MSNSYFWFPTSLARFVRNTLARANDVNARLDEVSVGFSGVETDLALKAPLANPTLTGTVNASGATTVTVPTPASLGDDSTKAATTAWVQDVVGASSVSLPVQTSHAGEVLTTDGTVASWGSPFPDQAGNAGQALFTDGSTAAWTEVERVVRRSILDTAAATMAAVSSMEPLENTIEDSGLTTTARHLVYGASLFVLSGAGNSSNVATSPDGEVWTLRAMPSSRTWLAGTDGTNFVAVANSATVTATSTSGTSWSSAAALPGNPKANLANPVFNGSTCFVLADAASTAYTSTDYGASWATQTLPSTTGLALPFVVGGLFWYWYQTATAYTSATGATGSFTSRTLPITPAAVFQDFDGSLWIAASNGRVLYRTTDGINWTLTDILPPGIDAANTLSIHTINGRYIAVAATGGKAYSTHADGWVAREACFPASTVGSGLENRQPAKNGAGTIYLFTLGTTGQVARIAPAAADAAFGYFVS